jgi:hypothetical protein
MDWLWLTCGLICAWATLRVIGAERERRVTQLLADHDSVQASPAAETATPPVRSKAGR